MVINYGDLSNINEYLAEFANGVGEEIEQAAQKIAKEAVKELKATSPKRKAKGGTYAKGWRAKKMPDGSWVVHNATNYQLTHLLEKGHAKVGGGRVNAITHIQPIEQKAIRKFLKEVEEAIIK